MIMQSRRDYQRFLIIHVLILYILRRRCLMSRGKRSDLLIAVHVRILCRRNTVTLSLSR